MNRNPVEASNDWIHKMYFDVKEYVERCFGVNDIEKRYEREAHLLQHSKIFSRNSQEITGSQRSTRIAKN